MNLRLLKPALPWLVAALTAPVFSAPAQDNAAAGQPIIFSTPQSDSSVTPGGPADSSPRDLSPAPPVIFDFTTSAMTPENPAARSKPLSTADQLRLKKSRDDHDNWMLMTPGEILGVTTPEKILQTREQQAADDKATALDRYLARQKQQQTAPAATNRGSSWNSFAAENFSPNGRNLNSPDAPRDRMGNPQSLMDRIMNGASTDRNPENPGPTYGWDSFSRPAILPLPQRKPPQPAPAFNDYLAAAVAQPAPAKVAPANKFLSLPDLNMNANPQPVINPNGASFKALESGIAKPTGLAPLPTLIQQPIAPPVTHSWWQQPPAWLATGPQPFTVPQRKF